MKVKPEHYAIIRDALKAKIAIHGKAEFLKHWAYLGSSENPNPPKDKARRFRWDCLWAAQNLHRDKNGEGFPFIEWNYQDAHLDTALRALMKEFDLPQ